jgi:hypothetical protein
VLFRYVELTSRNMGIISDAEFAEIRKHVSEAELVEIGNFMLLQIGFHVFFGTLKFYPFFAPDGRLVSQDESAQLYGATPVPLETEAAE